MQSLIPPPSQDYSLQPHSPLALPSLPASHPPPNATPQNATRSHAHEYAQDYSLQAERARAWQDEFHHQRAHRQGTDAQAAAGAPPK